MQGWVAVPRAKAWEGPFVDVGELISPLILARVDYQEAARHGSGVTELNPCSAAAEEMRGLWQSIESRLGHAKPGRAAREAA